MCVCVCVLPPPQDLPKLMFAPCSVTPKVLNKPRENNTIKAESKKHATRRDRHPKARFADGYATDHVSRASAEMVNHQRKVSTLRTSDHPQYA